MYNFECVCVCVFSNIYTCSFIHKCTFFCEPQKQVIHRKPAVGKHQLKRNILPETEFTYVIPCILDSLINICVHEKLSPKAGNQKTRAPACDVIERQVRTGFTDNYPRMIW